MHAVLSVCLTLQFAKGDMLDELVKCRGFSLRNVRAREKINYGVMKQMIHDWMNGKVETVETGNFTFRISRKDFSVTSAVTKKVYKNDNFNKRWLHPDEADKCIRTYPYGAQNPQFVDLPK